MVVQIHRGSFKGDEMSKHELVEHFRKNVGVDSVDPKKFKTNEEYKAARRAEYLKMQPEFERLKQLAADYPYTVYRNGKEVVKHGVSIAEYLEHVNHPERFKKNGRRRKDAGKRKKKRAEA